MKSLEKVKRYTYKSTKTLKISNRQGSIVLSNGTLFYLGLSNGTAYLTLKLRLGPFFKFTKDQWDKYSTRFVPDTSSNKEKLLETAPTDRIQQIDVDNMRPSFGGDDAKAKAFFAKNRLELTNFILHCLKTEHEAFWKDNSSRFAKQERTPHDIMSTIDRGQGKKVCTVAVGIKRIDYKPFLSVELWMPSAEYQPKDVQTMLRTPFVTSYLKELYNKTSLQLQKKYGLSFGPTKMLTTRIRMGATNETIVSWTGAA